MQNIPPTGAQGAPCLYHTIRFSQVHFYLWESERILGGLAQPFFRSPNKFFQDYPQEAKGVNASRSMGFSIGGFFFLFLFGHACGMRKFPGQGLNLRHSSDDAGS